MTAPTIARHVGSRPPGAPWPTQAAGLLIAAAAAATYTGLIIFFIALAVSP